MAIALGAGAASVVLFVHRDATSRPASRLSADSATAAVRDPEVATAYLAAAVSDLQVVTSSDYRTLDDELTAGLAVTTGAYQRSYRAALTGTAAAAAKRDQVVQLFRPLKSGIGDIADDGGSAKVLVFGVQHVQSRDGVADVPVTLTATLVRVAKRYLIANLDDGANAGLPPATAGVRAAAEAGRAEIARRVGGQVTAVALESADGDHVVLLIAASGARVAAADGRFEVTIIRQSGRWQVSRVAAVRAGG